MIHIRQITHRETWAIRQQVFQPMRALKKNKVQGDTEAMHFGAFSHDQLIGVVSWRAKGGVAKLRKLATLACWRRQGVATQLMQSCLTIMANQRVRHCSLLATQNSSAFYQSMGFEVVDPNVKRGSEHYIHMRLGLSSTRNSVQAQ